jgi:hypothetical protein
VKKSASKLREILQSQLDSGSSNLYFVLKQGSWETLQRYPAADIDRVIEELAGYQYLDTRLEIPYFEKQEKKSGSKTSR